VKALVYVEVRDGSPSADSLGVLTHARSLDGVEVEAVVCGTDTDAAVAAAGRHGARRVHVAEGAAFADPQPQPHVDALARVYLAHDFDVVLLATSILATDIAGGLAARLEAGVNWDLVDLVVDGDELVGRRLALGDGILVEVGWRSARRVATFRPGTFEPTAIDGDDLPDIVAVDADRQPWSAQVELVEQIAGESGDASLGDAEIIVAGGRGLGERENLQLVRALAAALGGVPAVSMPLVGEGWAPYAMQVGQTGTIVRPRLYVACGISGQMQHKVGMERSGTIVAINTDENAPITRFCDLAVIGDVREIVPALTDLIATRRETSP
jgi:electron transfer flavoprotein alpha subunit